MGGKPFLKGSPQRKGFPQKRFFLIKGERDEVTQDSY